MKKLILISSIAIVACLLVLSACDEGKKPNIAFKTGGSYTLADATVSKQDTLKIGINASKAESKDVLKKFNASVSYDGGGSTTLVSEDLSGAQGDNYDKDIQVITRNVAGKEKYTFTVTNRDGIIGQVSLTLTVN
jgi:hypothetical protein